MPHPTPAQYSIARRIAMQIIKEKWDTYIVPVLQQEGNIYVLTFQTFSFSKMIGHNQASGRELFHTIAKHEGIQSGHSSILDAAFDIYWDLAECSEYWLPGKTAKINNHIPFSQTTELWVRNNQDRATWCKERISEWRNGN